MAEEEVKKTENMPNAEEKEAEKKQIKEKADAAEEKKIAKDKELQKAAKKEKARSRRRARGPLARAASRTGGKTFRHKTRPGKELFELKNADKGKQSDYSVTRIKDFWKGIQKRQAEQLKKAKVSTIPAKISHIRIVADENGKESVKVSFAGGGSFHDTGKSIKMVQEIRKKTPPADKIYLLMVAIKEKGWRAVEGKIPPELRDEVLKACSAAGVSLTAPAKEEEAVRQQKAQRQQENQTMANNGFVPVESRDSGKNQKEQERYEHLANSLGLSEKEKKTVKETTEEIARLKAERSRSRNNVSKNRKIKDGLRASKIEQIAAILGIPKEIIEKNECLMGLGTAMSYATTEDEKQALLSLSSEMLKAIKEGKNPNDILKKNPVFQKCDKKRKAAEQPEQPKQPKQQGKSEEKSDSRKEDCIRKYKSLGMSDDEAGRKMEQLFAKTPEEIKKGLDDLEKACIHQKVSLLAEAMGIDITKISPESEEYKFLRENSKKIKKQPPNKEDIEKLKVEYAKRSAEAPERKQQKKAAQTGQENQFIKIATALGYSAEKIEELQRMSQDKPEKKSINRAIQYFNKELKRLTPEEQKKKLQKFVALSADKQQQLISQPKKEKTETNQTQQQEPKQPGQISFKSKDKLDATMIKLSVMKAALQDKDNPDYDAMRKALAEKEIYSVEDFTDEAKLNGALNGIDKKAYGFEAWNAIREANGQKPFTQEKWDRFTASKENEQSQQQEPKQPETAQEKPAEKADEPKKMSAAELLKAKGEKKEQKDETVLNEQLRRMQLRETAAKATPKKESGRGAQWEKFAKERGKSQGR